MGQQEAGRSGEGTAFAVLVALSVSHLLNDTIQSLIAAVYPVLKDAYALYSRRTSMASQEDTSIDGKKILLG